MHVCLGVYGCVCVCVCVLVYVYVCVCVCLVVANSEIAFEIRKWNNCGSRNDRCLEVLALDEDCPRRA